MQFPKQFFVTGTDTDVGKTYISAFLMQALNCDYWKPIQTGTCEGSDTEWMKQHTKLPDSRFAPEAYRFIAPLSPHSAAELENTKIDLAKIQLPARDRLIVEGAGGVLVPINNKTLMIDLIASLGLPVVVIARSGLGTINHTLLTLSALRHRSIPVVGVICNDPPNPHNIKSIHYYGNTDVISFEKLRSANLAPF